MTISAKNRANLDKLATYLENLPRDYQHFDMGTFTNIRTTLEETTYAEENGGLSTYDGWDPLYEKRCGAVACAVGHGPAAGLLVRPQFISVFGVNWFSYSLSMFGHVYDWCFTGEWNDFDNTHYGAAARIRYLLDNDRPPHDYEYPGEEWLSVYKSYLKEVPA